MNRNSNPDGRFAHAALVIAHPGHELRVHGWLELARPVTFVLSNGNGHHRRPRIASTALVLSRVGARPGSIFGRFDDDGIYAALMQREDERLGALAGELASAFVAHDIRFVLADAAEGHDGSHDICNHVALAAAQLASAQTGRPIEAFDFPLLSSPDRCPPHLLADAVHLHLNDDALARKLRAARAYPDMRDEFERFAGINGVQSLRTECLRPARLLHVRRTEEVRGTFLFARRQAHL